MALFRFIALILIVLGLMLLGADVVTMLESGHEPMARSLENVWALFAPDSVAASKAWLAAMLPAAGVQAITLVLSLPAFAVFGVLGIIFAVAFREQDEFA
jgi:hypothetical protein